MTMETTDDGFKHIEQGVNSSNNIIRHFKKAEKALKAQEEAITALKEQLAKYQNKEKSHILSKDNTGEAIINLQKEVKSQKRKMQELSRENEDIKKENEKLKSKMNDIHTSLLKRPVMSNFTKNQTKIPRLKKRSNPFAEIERRFSYTGITNSLSTNKKKKPNDL